MRRTPARNSAGLAARSGEEKKGKRRGGWGLLIGMVGALYLAGSKRN
jgi:hypothetical protein